MAFCMGYRSKFPPLWRRCYTANIAAENSVLEVILVLAGGRVILS